MLFSDFLLHLSKAYEQFNMTEDAKDGNAFMCHVLNGLEYGGDAIVQRYFHNATGLDILDKELAPVVSKLVSEIFTTENNHGGIPWIAAIRKENFGKIYGLEGDSSTVCLFAYIYSNELRQKWLMELHIKYKELGQ